MRKRPQRRRGAAERLITKAVVPAAGRGTRLLPATRSQPKEMLPVGRKPTIQHVVEELAAAGLREVLLISGQGKRAIEDHLDRDVNLHGEGHHPWMDLRFFHARQSAPRGLADAVGVAEPFAAGQPFVVALGDSIVVSRAREPLLKRMLSVHTKRRPAATVAVEEVPHEAVNRYGIVAPKGETNSVFAIRDIVEKPSPSKAPSNLAAAGRYVLAPVIFDAIRRIEPGVGRELQLTDALRLLLREGQEIVCVRLRKGEHRLDIGNFLSYFQAFLELSLADPELGATLRAWMRARLHGGGKEG
ncbi:MAG: UTP--glucose-1-phosphate uridylyltransferase [Armatimonadota bacterium]|nr:MAG: UTP--glucose-1-phosphate uridylyltransferase [Armatimonadota bacterium]